MKCVDFLINGGFLASISVYSSMHGECAVSKVRRFLHGCHAVSE